MGSFDIERKELEIREILGNLYGTRVYWIVESLFYAAYVSRSYSISSQRQRAIVAEELEQKSKSDPSRDILKMEEESYAHKAERFLDHAKKLESEIAPKVFALYRLTEIIETSDVTDYETSSHLNLIREKIVEGVEEVEDSLTAESWKSMLGLMRMEKKFKKHFKELMKSGKPFIQQIEESYKQHTFDTQQLFLNNQEWAMAQIFADVIFDMQREIKNQLSLSYYFIEKGELEKAERQKNAAYGRRRSMKNILRTFIAILLIGRQYGMAMSKVFQEAEAGHESSDVFELITTYINDAWDPVFRKAQFYVTPMIELNEIQIQHFFGQN